MSSHLEFVEYIADQCRAAGVITYKKMFGDYGLYCGGKIFALICDDEFFVKITEAGSRSDFQKSRPMTAQRSTSLWRMWTTRTF